MYLQLGNIFIKYDRIKVEDFLLSPIWVEYYQAKELTLFKEKGVTDEWIVRNIFEYEENTNGNGRIFYAIIGDIFYSKKEFIYIKSTIVFNNKYFFNAYSTFVREDRILQQKTINFQINKKEKTLFYLKDLWENENNRVIKSISKHFKEEIESIYIYTERKFSNFTKPIIKFL